MSPAPFRRSLVSGALVLSASALVAVACSSSTKDGGSSGSVVPGGCSEADRPADDGCNACGCVDGAWECTLMDCPRDGGGSIAGGRGVGGAGASGAGGRGNVGGPGGAGGGVASGGATSAGCVPGEVQKAPDGCNTCTCGGNGVWACTERACNPQPLCKTGDVMGNCNECRCVDGTWACTDVYCPEPADAGPGPTGCGARLGDTCGPDEYCAYAAGELCGGADGTSTCRARPQACDDIYAPVCGCDRKTYSSDCQAGRAGTGVYSTGPCATD